MSRVVFLLEELSMKAFLEGFLPRFFPGLSFLCVVHEGKSDLEKSIPKKLRAWRIPGDQFIVIRDNDGNLCLELKQRLQELCRDGGRPETLIRLACQELEAWFLGQPNALAEAFQRPGIEKLFRKAHFRDPDKIVRPSDELKKIFPEFQKISGARRLANVMTVDESISCSFHVFIEGIRRLSA